MTNPIEDKFIETILENLKANGFPQKKVSFPLEKMYEIAGNKGLNFNTVLERLKKEEMVDHSKDLDKIIFSKTGEQGSEQFKNMDFKNMDQQKMMASIQEMISKMDPEELRKIQEEYAKMSPEEKEEVMKKGKEMGLI